MAPSPYTRLVDKHQIAFTQEDQNDDDDEDASAQKYYKSERILGELYRNIDEKQIWNDDILRTAATSGPSVWDQFVPLARRQIEDMQLPSFNWNAKRERAWQLRNVYEDILASLMKQYSDSPTTDLKELEVFCGFIFNPSGIMKHRQRDKSRGMREEFERRMQFIIAEMRLRSSSAQWSSYDAEGQVASQDDLFTDNDDADELGTVATSDMERHREAAEFCWSCLNVALVTPVGGEADTEQYSGNGQMESFKVVAASCLLQELKIL